MSLVWFLFKLSSLLCSLQDRSIVNSVPSRSCSRLSSSGQASVRVICSRFLMNLTNSSGKFSRTIFFDAYCIAYIYSCFGYHNTISFLFSLSSAVLRIRVRDPVPFWPLDPGWKKNLDPGWTSRILDPGWNLCSTWVVIPFTFTNITSLTKIAKNFTLNIPDLIIEKLVSVPEYWFKNA